MDGKTDGRTDGRGIGNRNGELGEGRAGEKKGGGGQSRIDGI